MKSHVESIRERLDLVLVRSGLAPSREQAARLIMAGAVRVEGKVVDKPATLVRAEASIELVRKEISYVSRGGEKLAAALDAFGIVPMDWIALDVGASTGGFTDCLLRRGAARVYAVDVGYGQLAWSLRQDRRVVVIDRQNIRYLSPDRIPEPIHIGVIDVSFISLTLVLPVVIQFLDDDAWLVALVKPQFEVGKGQVGRGGIVRDEGQRQAVLEKVVTFSQGCGLTYVSSLDSPITGLKGNREFLVGWKWGGRR
jgi:23S rRNA (cytidine1920-2'-O)/16S rRNA (cytidine1409-2'-O)-methyltransferase